MKKRYILMLFALFPAFLTAMDGFDDVNFQDFDHLPNELLFTNEPIVSLEEIAHSEKTERPVGLSAKPKKQPSAIPDNQGVVTNAPVQTDEAFKELQQFLYPHSPVAIPHTQHVPPTIVNVAAFAPGMQPHHQNPTSLLQCRFCLNYCKDLLHLKTHLSIYHEKETQRMHTAALQQASLMKAQLLAKNARPILQPTRSFSIIPPKPVGFVQPALQTVIRKNKEPRQVVPGISYITKAEEKRALEKQAKYVVGYEKSFCEICRQAFKCRAQLGTHCHSFHHNLLIPGTSSVGRLWWKCPKCEEKIRTANQLMGHLLVEHTNAPNSAQNQEEKI